MKINSVNTTTFSKKRKLRSEITKEQAQTVINLVKKDLKENKRLLKAGEALHLTTVLKAELERDLTVLDVLNYFNKGF